MKKITRLRLSTRASRLLHGRQKDSAKIIRAGQIGFQRIMPKLIWHVRKAYSFCDTLIIDPNVNAAPADGYFLAPLPNLISAREIARQQKNLLPVARHSFSQDFELRRLPRRNGDSASLRGKSPRQHPLQAAAARRNENNFVQSLGPRKETIPHPFAQSVLDRGARLFS
jgi:hypothetical protein